MLDANLFFASKLYLKYLEYRLAPICVLFDSLMFYMSANGPPPCEIKNILVGFVYLYVGYMFKAALN